MFQTLIHAFVVCLMLAVGLARADTSQLLLVERSFGGLRQSAAALGQRRQRATRRLLDDIKGSARGPCDAAPSFQQAAVAADRRARAEPAALRASPGTFRADEYPTRRSGASGASSTDLNTQLNQANAAPRPARRPGGRPPQEVGMRQNAGARRASSIAANAGASASPTCSPHWISLSNEIESNRLQLATSRRRAGSCASQVSASWRRSARRGPEGGLRNPPQRLETTGEHPARGGGEPVGRSPVLDRYRHADRLQHRLHRHPAAGASSCWQAHQGDRAGAIFDRYDQEGGAQPGGHPEGFRADARRPQQHPFSRPEAAPPRVRGQRSRNKRSCAFSGNAESGGYRCAKFKKGAPHARQSGAEQDPAVSSCFRRRRLRHVIAGPDGASPLVRRVSRGHVPGAGIDALARHLLQVDDLPPASLPAAGPASCALPPAGPREPGDGAYGIACGGDAAASN